MCVCVGGGGGGEGGNCCSGTRNAVFVLCIPVHF